MLANSQTYKRIKQLGNLLLNFTLPPACLACHTPQPDPHSLCHSCWSELDFISQRLCHCCGTPLHDLNEELTLSKPLCPICIKHERHFDQARSSLIYDDFTNRLVVPYKLMERTELATLFSNIMLQTLLKQNWNIDYITPVPLHSKRQRKRHYNQAALLSAKLARKRGYAHKADLLIRHRFTKPQGEMGKRRYANVKGAFTLNPDHQDNLKNKTILLIDDVYTTGATAEQCAKVLKKHGAKKVFVLTLCRAILK